MSVSKSRTKSLSKVLSKSSKGQIPDYENSKENINPQKSDLPSRSVLNSSENNSAKLESFVKLYPSRASSYETSIEVREEITEQAGEDGGAKNRSEEVFESAMEHEMTDGTGTFQNFESNEEIVESIEEIEESAKSSEESVGDGESECYNYGEPPSRYQHLRYDFTPIKGLDDNEERIQKCIDFWNFVNRQPEINQMIAVPRKQKEKDYVKDDAAVINKIMQETTEQIPLVKTAMQWTAELPLNYLGKPTLEICPGPSPYSRSMQSLDSMSGSGSDNSHFWSLPKPKDGGNVRAHKRATEETKKIIADMEEFDQTHPRTFEPFRLRQNLINADLQRLPPITYYPQSCQDNKREEKSVNNDSVQQNLNTPPYQCTLY